MDEVNFCKGLRLSAEGIDEVGSGLPQWVLRRTPKGKGPAERNPRRSRRTFREGMRKRWV